MLMAAGEIRKECVYLDRIIFHVDVNSAFLSWEAARRVQNGERIFA